MQTRTRPKAATDWWSAQAAEGARVRRLLWWRRRPLLLGAGGWCVKQLGRQAARLLDEVHEQALVLHHGAVTRHSAGVRQNAYVQGPKARRVELPSQRFFRSTKHSLKLKVKSGGVLLDEKKITGPGGWPRTVGHELKFESTRGE